MNLPDNFSLNGRVALVTGSTRGIGRALALGLAKAGAAIVVHGTRDCEQARRTLKEVQAIGVKAALVLQDLSAENAARQLIDAARDALGPVDILVANASVQLPKPWLEGTREDFDLQVAVNVRCTYEMIKRVTPTMKERGWGRILTIGSVQESKPHPDMLIYAATKSAQSSLVLNLARQLAPHGITLNNLAPGVIKTDRNIARLADEAYRKTVESWIPMGRTGGPEDCVGAAQMLCSDAASYITGQTLYVDGGMSL